MTYVLYLVDRYRLVLHHVGTSWILTGIITTTPLLALPFYPAEWPHAPAFFFPGLAVAVTGSLLRHGGRTRSASAVSKAEGTVILVIAWITAVFVSAIPFVFVSGLTLTQAVFESMSGWTTTGLSVVDVTKAPRLILLHRSIIQLCGGAGFAILMLTALAGPVGAGIAAAEGRTDQLEPHVRRSAVLVLRIYSVAAILGALALYLAGMSPFDAINHAFAALSTGGFSTRPESIGFWDDPWIETVVLLIMILGNTNFLITYTLLQGNWRAVRKTGEIRLFTSVLVISMLFILTGVTLTLYPTFDKAVRVAIFETVSALTTTGFSTVGYAEWSGFGIFILVLLMLIGGGSGSTAGGIKQFRVYLLFRGLIAEIKRPFLPENAVLEPEVWHGDRRIFVTDSMLRQTALFVLVYFLFYGIGVLVTLAFGYSLSDSLFEMASAFGTVGLSVGITSPTTPASLLWLEIFAMLLGRLEFFPVFLGFGRLIMDAANMFQPQMQRPFVSCPNLKQQNSVKNHA